MEPNKDQKREIIERVKKDMIELLREKQEQEQQSRKKG